MAKNITVAGASYTDVPSVELPITGGGTASFIDPEDAETALGSDGSVDLDDAIEALTTYSNEVTGASDTTLSSAVATLANGYGSGGGGISTTDFNTFMSGSSSDIDFSGVTSIKSYGLTDCNLNKPIFPDVTSIGSFIANGISNSVLVFPALTQVSANGLRNAGSNLTTLDFGSNMTSILTYCFYTDSALTTIILRSSSVVSLSNVNSFNNTPFKSGGSGGTIYVPSDLISSYQSATNWSTINGYGTVTWVAIEGSQYENYYADGTAIS